MKLEELILLLKQSNTAEDIDKYREEIIELIPEISVMIEFDQQNQSHQYDLWYHSLHTAVNLPKDIKSEYDIVYLAALLHDIGKPDCQIYGTKDGKINIHYYNYPEKSYEITRDNIIPNLHNKDQILCYSDQRLLLYFIRYHDDRVSLRPKHLKRHLNLGATIEEFQTLMKLEIADAKAHIIIPIIQERIDICTKLASDFSYELYDKYIK